MGWSWTLSGSVKTHDVNYSRLYMVMEWVEGRLLVFDSERGTEAADRISGELTLQQRCAGHLMHKHGVVHRSEAGKRNVVTMRSTADRRD